MFVAIRNYIRQNKILSLLLAYLAIGGFYGIIPYIELIITGRDVTFSPIVGIPLSLIFWPQFLYANIIHGIWLRDVIVYILILAFILFFAKKWAPNKQHKEGH